jgi:hypothetical protein
MTFSEINNRLRHAPIILGAAILVVMISIATGDNAALAFRAVDDPPTVEFDWTPDAVPADLRTLVGHLRMRDDYGLDFTTYRLKFIETGRVVDMPIPGMLGKDYEQTVSLSWLADKPEMAGLDKLTLEFSIADDKGQKSVLTKTIKLK